MTKNEKGNTRRLFERDCRMGSPFIDELSLHDFRHQHQRETEDDVNPCKIKELPEGSSFSFCLMDQLTTPAKLTLTSLFTV